LEKSVSTVTGGAARGTMNVKGARLYAERASEREVCSRFVEVCEESLRTVKL
jgi:hypothetical protein